MGLYEEFLQNIPLNFQAELEKRNQDFALEKIAEKIDCGEKIIVYEGRTGIGKSIINYAIAKTFGSSFYITPRVQLVEQIANEAEFEGIQKVVGSKNYPCNIKSSLMNPKITYTSRTTKEERVVNVSNGWTKSSAPCSLDDGFNYREMNESFGCGTPAHLDKFDKITCPYAVDLIRANQSDMVVLTADMFLSSWHLQKKRKIVVIDEVHKLESVVEKYLGIQISFEDLGLDKKKVLPKSIREFLPCLNDYQNSLELEQQNFGYDLELQRKKKPWDIFELIKIKSSCDRSKKRLEKVQEFLDDTDSYFFFPTKNGFSIKPKSFASFFQEHFGSYKYLVISSATLPRPYSYFSSRFGLEETNPIYMPAIFDSRRNPIYVPVVASINRGNMEQQIALHAPLMAELISKHKGQRGIIGCNSGRLVNLIVDGLKKHLSKEQHNRLMYYTSAGDLRGNRKAQDYYLNEKDGVFRKSKDGVLIGTSLEDGHDFKDGLCRFIIVPKIPFADLGDAEVRKKKEEHGNIWYSGDAVVKLIQLAGRGMRHDKDYCSVYVFDGNLKRLLWYDSERDQNLFPNDFKESVFVLNGTDSLVKLVNTVEDFRKGFLGAEDLDSLEKVHFSFGEQTAIVTRSVEEKIALVNVLSFYEQRKKELGG